MNGDTGQYRDQMDSRSASASAVIRGLNRPEATSQQTRPPILVGLAFLAYLGTFLGLLLTSPFSESTFTAVTDLMGIAPPFVACALSVYAERRSAGQVRVAWRCIAVGCFAWGLGEVVWTVYEVGLNQQPFPSMADAGYLGMLPPMAIGVLLLSSRRRNVSDITPTFDGIALVLTLAAFLWFFVLHPTYTESGASLLEKVIGSAYPIGDVVLAYWVLVAIRRQWGFREGAVLSVLLGGMLALIAADVGFAYLTLEDGYTTSSIVNLGWPAGFLLIGYAAALSGGWGLAYAEGEPGAPRFWSELLPLGLLPPMGLLGVVALRNEALVISVPLLVMLGIASVAVVARLALDLGLAEELDDSRQRLSFWMSDDGEHDRAA
jgi:hypothetical protein